jgi:nucleoside-diphosphate-sugar epimerase
VAVLIQPTSDVWRITDVMDQVVRFRAGLEDVAFVEAPIAAFHPEVVVHVAWAGTASHLHNDTIQIANLHSGLGLLGVAQRAGIRHWVGVGSQAEYGVASQSSQEDTVTLPTTLYGITKLCLCLLTEGLCAAWGLRFAWLRLFSSYGPGDSPERLIPYVILKLLKGQRPALTEASQHLDLLYAEDIAEAVCRAAVSPAATGIYNLGSGQARSLRTVLEEVRDLIDPRLRLGFGEVPYPPDQVMHRQADIRRLSQDVGWLPRVSLEEGLRRTLAWYRKPTGSLAEAVAGAEQFSAEHCLG